MTTEKDREDHEEGQRDRASGTIDQVVTDISGNHPDTAPYYEGRAGEQLDADKDEEKEEKEEKEEE